MHQNHRHVRPCAILELGQIIERCRSSPLVYPLVPCVKFYFRVFRASILATKSPSVPMIHVIFSISSSNQWRTDRTKIRDILEGLDRHRRNFGCNCILNKEYRWWHSLFTRVRAHVVDGPGKKVRSIGSYWRIGRHRRNIGCNCNSSDTYFTQCISLYRVASQSGYQLISQKGSLESLSICSSNGSLK
jgi:hypothetical protein